MSRRLLALVAAAAATVAFAGCSSAAEEPEGLGDPAATASGSPPADETPAPAPSGEPDTSPEPQDEPEPSPTFTQPFLPPGEQSVIDLPTELAIAPPDDATDDERAVLAAAGRFMASWDAILFGAGDEQSGIFTTSADPQLGRLIGYLVESVSKQRVIVGEPTEITLRDVSVNDDSAEVDLCTVMRDWVQYTGGTPEPQPEVERLILTLTLHDGSWLASDTEQADPESCE